MTIRRVLLAGLAAGLWPAIPVYAADATPPSDSPSVEQSAASRPSSTSGLRADGRTSGLKLEADAAQGAATGGQGASAASDPAHYFSFDPQRHAAQRGAPSAAAGEENRYSYSLSTRAGVEPALRFSRHDYVPKVGWAWSGRVGPLRWLGNLDGESDTMLRLGGRAPGQPRMPGTGLFNVGIHYNFE